MFPTTEGYRDGLTMFANKISELTVNSRDIIDALTLIAKENSHQVEGIVQVVESRILKCPPEYCLPAMYLMDALIKNIGVPYKDVFRTKLCRIVVETYNRVHDIALRSKLCHLLTTWPQYYGSELVADICYAIRDLQFHTQTPSIAVQAIELLQRSRNNGKVSVPPVSAMTAPYPPHNYTGQHGGMGTQSSNYPAVPSYNAGGYPPVHSNNPPVPLDVNTLLKALTQRPAADLPTNNNKQRKINSPEPVKKKYPKESKQQTRNPIGCKFTTNALKNSPWATIDALYDESATICTQCGFRFKDSNKLDSHQDWHFRRNSSKKSKTSSRDWFLPLDEWKNYQGLEDTQSASTSSFDQEIEPVIEEKVDHRVPKDESQSECKVCNEGFKTEYDSDEEQWMYSDTIRSNLDNQIYHVYCYKPEEGSSLGKRAFEDQQDKDEEDKHKNKIPKTASP